VNLVNTAGVNTVINSTTVASQLLPVGWLYIDNNGGLWFAEDPLANWTIGVNINVNASFGLSLTPPIARAAVPVPKQMSSPISNNIVVSKCWKQGLGLTPGAWG
jgi:hypothetical protein